jgi:hypothetical protein
MEVKLTEKAVSSPVVDRTHRRANDVTIMELSSILELHAERGLLP